MEIIRGTTPSITVNLEDGVKFSDLGTVILRIRQGWTCIDKEPSFIEESTGVFKYTQEETLKLYEGSASIQLIGVKGNGNEIVNKTITYPITILKSLWNEAVHDE